jgi:hypothetical protein
MLVFLALGNLSSTAQDTIESCSNGLKIALSADYAGPWVSGRASEVSFQYALSHPKFASAAWIEVWDGLNRLSQHSVKVQARGEVVWTGLRKVPETPSNLQLSIFDPELSVFCADNCSSSSKGGTVSTVLAGTAPGEVPPFPSLDWGSSRFMEGDQWAELVFEGRLLGSQTAVLLEEQDGAEQWRRGSTCPLNWSTYSTYGCGFRQAT